MRDAPAFLPGRAGLDTRASSSDLQPLIERPRRRLQTLVAAMDRAPIAVAVQQSLGAAEPAEKATFRCAHCSVNVSLPKPLGRYQGKSMPAARKAVSICSAQPRFALGLAGLGCGTPPSRAPLPASTSATRRSAKRPMPNTQRGWRISTVCNSARSQAACSARRCGGGSLSGVRLPPSSRKKQRGQ